MVGKKKGGWEQRCPPNLFIAKLSWFFDEAKIKNYLRDEPFCVSRQTNKLLPQ